MKLGGHSVKSWSSTQATVALSSAEAELYALTKGASQVLGLMSLMDDFGVAITASVHADASAAIGIVRRSGLGKLRHLNVRYLWLQDQVQADDFELKKVHGLVNPADLMTKYLAPPDAAKHLEMLGMERPTGRASTAPTLSAILAADEANPRPVPGGMIPGRSPRATK